MANLGPAISALRSSGAKQFDLLVLDVSAATGAGIQGQFPVVNLPNPVSGIMLLPIAADESTNQLISSGSACVYMRFNQRGPWLPFSMNGWQLGNGASAPNWTKAVMPGFISYTGLIYCYEYFIYVPDQDSGANGNPQMVFLLLYDPTVSLSGAPSTSGNGISSVFGGGRGVGGGGGTPL